MFKCAKCEAHEDEIEYLRGQIKTMTDRLVALANLQAFQAVSFERGNASEFYGGGEGDQYVGYDKFGAKVLLEKEKEDPKE